MSSSAAARPEQTPAPRDGDAVARPGQTPAPRTGDAAPRAGDDASRPGQAPRSGPEIPAPRGATEPTAPVTSGRSDPAGLRARVQEARERLLPERPVIPAPRSPGGVDVPPPFGRGAHAPAPALVTATDALAASLDAVDPASDEPGHRALARIVELTATGIPDGGWSVAEGITPDALEAAATSAAALRDAAADLLRRLDEADLPAPAAAIDSLATSLRVVHMVADLEVFAVTRG